jgi:lipid-A-disaccharide synthase
MGSEREETGCDYAMSETSKKRTTHRASPVTNNSSLKIMVVAGEASGDKHGAALARALRQLYPDTQFEMFGAGGDEMRAAGVETLVDAREVAIIGIPEIARAIGKLYRAYRKLLDAARERRPSAIVLIDWPDFNMRLARKLRRAGFKIIYYISPQVWAWRGYRVRALRRDVDRMLVILPFEEEFYKKAGVEVEYVGHPLAEAVRATATREEFVEKHGLDDTRPIIALLPGSRQKEIHYHLPAMLDAARRLRSFPLRIANREPRIAGAASAHGSNSLTTDTAQDDCASPVTAGPQFVLPLANTISREQVEAVINEASAEGGIEIKIAERETYNALSHAEFAIVASGTATVEAALAGTPMVIIYRGSELNWRLIRPLIHLDTFGMVNLIAGRRIVPELMQKDVTGEKIAREVRALLSDPARLDFVRGGLDEVSRRLKAGGGGGALAAAHAVMRTVRGLD